MSSGLTALFTSLPGFLLLMVLGQNPDQKLPYFRYFPGTPGPSYVSLLSVLTELWTFSRCIYNVVIDTLTICPPLATRQIRLRT